MQRRYLTRERNGHDAKQSRRVKKLGRLGALTEERRANTNYVSTLF
jgi:hypothetical protein